MGAKFIHKPSVRSLQCGESRRFSPLSGVYMLA